MGRVDGQRRVAETLVDGTRALGQILIASDDLGSPGVADAASPTNGIVFTGSQAPKLVTSGAARTDMAGGFRALSGLVSTGDATFSQVLKGGTEVVHAITAVGDALPSNRFAFAVNPDATYTLTSTPSISEPATLTGIHVVFCYNVSSFALTVQDEGNLAGSQIKGIGGANVVIAANGGRAGFLWSPTNEFWYCLFNTV